MLRPGPHREGEEPKPMMNERGKSDTAVGAMKPANKAERSAAELVEQRAGTKGNAEQQSPRRAQERESVSQALGRIRQAAKQRKKEKFTTLFHHISVGLLKLAFFEIKKDAAPGVDGLTWQGTRQDSTAISKTCTHGAPEERIGHSRAVDCTYQNQMADSVQSRLPPSKTRSSRGRLPRSASHRWLS